MASQSLLSFDEPEDRPAGQLHLWIVGGLAILSVALVCLALGSLAAAGLFAAALFAGLAVILSTRRQAALASAAPEADWPLLRVAAGASDEAVAVTGRGGALICANDRFAAWLGEFTNPGAADGDGRLAETERVAWRDGNAVAADVRIGGDAIDVEVTRAGYAQDHLVWRFRRAETIDLVDQARRLISGAAGRRLGEAGLMVALVAGDGTLLEANPVFLHRALGGLSARIDGQDFITLLTAGTDDLIRFANEGESASPLRFVQVPLRDDPDSDALFLLLDEHPGARASAAAEGHLNALLSMLPLGLALADRDGRFLFFNQAFEHAAGITPETRPVYPSDLVEKEDKGAVADAVRRFASGGTAFATDLAVRLKDRPDEPVALTIASARGLGDATVLLSLKDNSEEVKLKRQVAQATKMQAVGQLAGGVAHDFNNILTAIIGHCDLMMMRHSPGDSDYDDIQQIKHNSNRAAGLTRQLLAFSRQQTLRPQLLQVPDVVSEVSNLLKRLLGETVTLTVKHGRDLGTVRADPGQLEQVIVNLAVNSRDAMPDGGTLTIQTFAVPASQVKRIDSEIMPVVDYTALKIADTGTGIPPDIIGKVFEPFFTTKEVGKGTGLGLSTVYGIVKQTGGFIFADSVMGEGTSFTIYLPVHHAETAAAPAAKAAPAKANELWGTGTVLLVEDEDMVRAVAERALTRQGYAVVTASNGEEALELLEERDLAIDLLISDVVMPVMDGPTMVRTIREKLPDIPVLFMSGYAEEQLRRSIDLDRVAFLPKPFSVQQLAEAARDAAGLK
ncbi:response regulator [Sphingomonas sp. ID0503]|uniref:hybrid sensor histidine kinase/response regulator n=1 Tax=Sphingomonas sp. ID0503 TaxID=3399691 RepID=UPI003AFA360F